MDEREQYQTLLDCEFELNIRRDEALYRLMVEDGSDLPAMLAELRDVVERNEVRRRFASFAHVTPQLNIGVFTDSPMTTVEIPREAAAFFAPWCEVAVSTYFCEE